MDSKHLLAQLNQKRKGLRSLKGLLNELIPLKKGRVSILNDSVQRLNIALQNHQSSDQINQLKEKIDNVDHNENMYTDYKNKIIDTQRGIEIAEQEIKILEQLLGTFPDKKPYCVFYQQKKDDNDDRQNFSRAFIEVIIN